MSGNGRARSGPVPRAMLRDPGHLVALGFGSGCVPMAPGTVGTLVGVVLYLSIAGLPLGYYLIVVLAGFAVGVWVCERTAETLGVHDHSAIVWDEVVGYLVTMIAVPPKFLWVFIGFVLFRFFDILKPWPVRTIDRTVKGGLGVMLDDVLAAFYALFCLHLIIYLSLSYR